MEEAAIDFLLVPLGLCLLVVYHLWLVLTIYRNPRRTVIGLNAESRRQWVFCVMTDPLKNGVLAVQTIRNNIMASTLLATTAITLSSLIGVFVSSSSDMSNAKLHLIYGNKSALCTSIKYFSILLCFLVAFLCNVQSIRYYAHISFLATVPTWRDQKESIQYVARNLNRGSHFCRSLKEDQEVDLESPRQVFHSGFVVDNSVPQYTAASFGRANKMALTIPYSGALNVFGLKYGKLK
ncbi:uncharacterized protein E6C27_scaffold274G004170 [Cucumis melo var. makuwa]|uniref:Uncharacterized protein n=1 Tax=Cucumis melo var. makuwa TaxID=1194695 RepID=A0A5A7UX60_CUCMM|nr:uncharacterized protein E6C27_scaffold274G004170 [Cucumis melo var. makuwa]